MEIRAVGKTFVNVRSTTFALATGNNVTFADADDPVMLKNLQAVGTVCSYVAFDASAVRLVTCARLASVNDEACSELHAGFGKGMASMRKTSHGLRCIARCWLRTSQPQVVGPCKPHASSAHACMHACKWQCTPHATLMGSLPTRQFDVKPIRACAGEDGNGPILTAAERAMDPFV